MNSGKVRWSPLNSWISKYPMKSTEIQWNPIKCVTVHKVPVKSLIRSTGVYLLYFLNGYFLGFNRFSVISFYNECTRGH